MAALGESRKYKAEMLRSPTPKAFFEKRILPSFDQIPANIDCTVFTALSKAVERDLVAAASEFSPQAACFAWGGLSASRTQFTNYFRACMDGLHFQPLQLAAGPPPFTTLFDRGMAQTRGESEAYSSFLIQLLLLEAGMSWQQEYDVHDDDRERSVGKCDIFVTDSGAIIELKQRKDVDDLFYDLPQVFAYAYAHAFRNQDMKRLRAVLTDAFHAILLEFEGNVVRWICLDLVRPEEDGTLRLDPRETSKFIGFIRAPTPLAHPPGGEQE